MKHLKKICKIRLHQIRHMRLKLSLENFNQVSIMILLLLVANSSTALTGGLSTMFSRKSSFFGIPITAEKFILLSTFWGLKTCFLVKLKSLLVEKIFLRTTSKVVALLWAFFATCRRILAVVCFFIPPMGLFNLAYHFYAEKLPMSTRVNFAKVHEISPNDKIYLKGLQNEVSWSEIDRWNYENPMEPKPPGYSFLYWF